MLLTYHDYKRERLALRLPPDFSKHRVDDAMHV